MTSSLNIAGRVSIQKFTLSSNNLDPDCGCSVRFIYDIVVVSNAGHCGLCPSACLAEPMFGFLEKKVRKVRVKMYFIFHSIFCSFFSKQIWT
jgi:hypothetical protein